MVSSLTNDIYLQTSGFRFIVLLTQAKFYKLKLYPRFKNIFFSKTLNSDFTTTVSHRETKDNEILS